MKQTLMQTPKAVPRILGSWMAVHSGRGGFQLKKPPALPMLGLASHELFTFLDDVELTPLLIKANEQVRILV